MATEKNSKKFDQFQGAMYGHLVRLADILHLSHNEPVRSLDLLMNEVLGKTKERGQIYYGDKNNNALVRLFKKQTASEKQSEYPFEFKDTLLRMKNCLEYYCDSLTEGFTPLERAIVSTCDQILRYFMRGMWHHETIIEYFGKVNIKITQWQSEAAKK